MQKPSRMFTISNKKARNPAYEISDSENIYLFLQNKNCIYFAFSTLKGVV